MEIKSLEFFLYDENVETFINIHLKLHNRKKESDYIDLKIKNYKEFLSLYKDAYVITLKKDSEYIGLLVFGYDKYKKISYLETLVIDEKYRNKGYGAKLIKKMKNILKKKSIITIETDSFSFPKVICFYEKQGFKKIDIKNSKAYSIHGNTWQFTKMSCKI